MCLAFAKLFQPQYLWVTRFWSRGKIPFIYHFSHGVSSTSDFCVHRLFLKGMQGKSWNGVQICTLNFRHIDKGKFIDSNASLFKPSLRCVQPHSCHRTVWKAEESFQGSILTICLLLYCFCDVYSRLAGLQNPRWFSYHNLPSCLRNNAIM